MPLGLGVAGTSVKVATQESALLGIVNEAAQGEGDQPEKVEPDAGAAERVTVAPGVYEPEPLTDPVPVPEEETVTAYVVVGGITVPPVPTLTEMLAVVVLPLASLATAVRV